jgi:hypothetical protein
LAGIQGVDQPPREVDRGRTRVVAAVNFECPSRLIDLADECARFLE